MKRKYSVLGIVAGVYQVFGLIAIFIGLIIIGLGVVGGANATNIGVGQSLALALPSGLAVIISGIVAFAFGQLINLLRDLELNTRRTSAYMYQIAKRNTQRTQRRAARRTTTTTTTAPPNYARPIVDEDVVQRTTTTTIEEPRP